MDKREQQRYRSERMKRRRRRRMRKKLMRAFLILLFIILGIFLVIFVLHLKEIFDDSSEAVMFEFPWEREEEEADIVLDAGHGGKDQGTSYGNILEKDITLEITKKTEDILKSSGYRVKLTREDDTFINIHKRAEAANRKNARVFVSIHCNSLEKGQADGIETYYAESKETDSQALAQAIQTNASEKTKALDRGVKTEDYVVVKETGMPAALIEVGFLSDANERELLQQEEYQQKLAEGIATGILEYLEALE